MNTWHLKLAARCIHAGGVIAYPTEAVYGLGCDPLNPEAVSNLLELKQRDVRKGLILIAANQDQLAPFIETPSLEIQNKLDATWPGPTTWLLPARPHVPRWLTGQHSSIAVRVTNHPLARALCLAADTAIISTSANISRQPSALNALTVRRIFRNRLDYILPGVTGLQRGPSTIRDAISDAILR